MHDPLDPKEYVATILAANKDRDWTIPMDRETQSHLITVLNYCETGTTEFSGGDDGLRYAVKALNDWLVEGFAAKVE